MSYLNEDKGRLRRLTTKEAIALAMQSRWQEAAIANRQIIESFPTDVDAYNRLGRALMELGKFAEAREAYSRALELDSHNTIARKNLERLSLLREDKPAPEARHRVIAPQVFVEERGKAGVVSLENLAPREAVAKRVAGDEVYLRRDGERLVIEDREGVYLGQVESRHAARLLRLMKGGNQYAAAIARQSPPEVKVVIREVYQHPSQAGRLSFSIKEVEPFRPYIRDTLVKYELEEEEAVEAPYAAEMDELEAQAEDVVLTSQEVTGQEAEERAAGQG